ncbi:Hypothetical_protein [Hexamita inflata]|uniref:Hypothetical_protein n=1 Tax=Hexamita inflata TaxID=28002 RepID=A0AA86N9T1_9EUKA|nr:Hypothetical protein HINF_LOCUS3065 [Hexamita inflata]
MILCKIIENKFFGNVEHTGFYQVENNCIVAHYFAKKGKIEYFYNLSDLTILSHSNCHCVLFDPKKKIQFIVNEIIAVSSQEMSRVESDKFFDFEAVGYKAYSEPMTQKPNSFTPDGVLRYFDEE